MFRIVAYTVAYNEELMIGYYLRHYLTFCDKVIVYDHDSTDKTRDIVRSFPRTEIRSFNTNGVIDDVELVMLKNSCYEEQRGHADFCIVSDVDEILYHPRLREFIQSSMDTGVTVLKTTGFDMISNSFPSCAGQIYDEIVEGVPNQFYAKRIAFRPDIEINFTPGCHFCNPQPDNSVKYSTESAYLLHYKYLSCAYVAQRYALFRSRLSAVNREFGWGAQYNLAENEIRAVFDELYKNRRRVVWV